MPSRAPRTLAQMVDHGFTSTALCSACNKSEQLDLGRLMAKVGPDYSLWNRRMRCRFTPGCSGWIKFFVGPGYRAQDYDARTEMRWMELEWAERMKRDSG